MKEQITRIFSFLKEYAHAAEAVFVLIITMILAIIQAYVFKKLYQSLKRKKKLWEKAIINALFKPLQWFIWIIGVTFSVDLLSGYSEDAFIFQIISPIRKVLVITVLVWFMLAFIKEIEKVLLVAGSDKRRMSKTTIRAISQVLKVFVIVTCTFIVLQTTLGVGASAILAFAGGGSISIGFAAKDLLSNFFGGLMIFLDRPFAIGERIRSSDGKTEGVVEEIGWRLTKIITLEKVPLYVPNSYFLSTSIENPSRMKNRRIKTTIGVRYQDVKKIPEIVKDVEAMLKSHEGIDQNNIVMARFTKFSASSLDLLVYAFTKTIQFDEFTKVQQDIFFKVMEIIEKHHASCAFPTTTVHIPEGVEMMGK
ncbi:mechanosensitive ion channel protein MscS [Candidatus Aerophobetes bacterium]|uniref:Mechanosensitive ion channel protein MscS n=1 Tax=Aerophobetes bacterium TaxID=2030807 RepID=A0A2A4YN21_UNCAE|nr:MAG: mechanosensitive ion channel protein MscS [Candidatus Aerophobetes bacterium]